MRTHSKTPLFLMELIIMLLVFSVSAAICLRVFTGAKKIADESRRLDAAVMMAQTAAEYWKSTHGDMDKTAEMMGVIPKGNRFVVRDEENWIYLEFSNEDMTAYIDVMNGEENVFSLTCEAVMVDE